MRIGSNYIDFKKKHACLLSLLSDASEFDDKLELSINSTGAPEIYFPLILEKFINGKLEENRISEHHPNILLINYLLDPSLQLASSLEDYTTIVPTGLDTVSLAAQVLIEK